MEMTSCYCSEDKYDNQVDWFRHTANYRHDNATHVWMLSSYRKHIKAEYYFEINQYGTEDTYQEFGVVVKAHPDLTSMTLGKALYELSKDHINIEEAELMEALAPITQTAIASFQEMSLGSDRR